MMEINKPACLSPQYTQVTQVQGRVLSLVLLVPGCHKSCSLASCKGRQVHKEDLARLLCLAFLPHEAAGTRTTVGLCALPPKPTPSKAAPLIFLSFPVEETFCLSSAESILHHLGLVLPVKPCHGLSSLFLPLPCCFCA